jgi:hypothetical protein
MVSNHGCSSGNTGLPVDTAAPATDPPAQLLSLPGTALKLYLSLLGLCDADSVCSSSCRALSRQSGLARQTIPGALEQLEKAKLVLPLVGGLRVDTGPLAALLAMPAQAPAEVTPTGTSMGHPVHRGGTELRPVAAAAGGQVCQPHGSGGREACQPDGSAGIEVIQAASPAGPEPGQRDTAGGPQLGHYPPKSGREVGHPLDRPTRARTSLPSSYEEGTDCTTPSPPLPPPDERERQQGTGDQDRKTTGCSQAAVASDSAKSPNPPQSPAGTDAPDPSWLTGMAALWTRIAPNHPADTESWFTQMWREHGSDIPVAALTRFVESGRSLADLDHPHRYQAYFRTCCTRLAAEAAGPTPHRSRSWHAGRTATTPGSAARAAAAAAGDDYRQDLRALYLAERHPGSDPEASTASPRPQPEAAESPTSLRRHRPAHAVTPREPPGPAPGRGPPHAVLIDADANECSIAPE